MRNKSIAYHKVQPIRLDNPSYSQKKLRDIANGKFEADRDQCHTHSLGLKITCTCSTTERRGRNMKWSTCIPFIAFCGRAFPKSLPYSFNQRELQTNYHLQQCLGRRSIKYQTKSHKRIARDMCSSIILKTFSIIGLVFTRFKTSVIPHYYENVLLVII